MNYILVVDDDQDILDALQFVLEDAGYTVQTSLLGETAEELNASNLPALLIMDVLLSGKDGREICQKLKKQIETKEMPIIMISAHPSASDSIKQAGADAFLAKPFNINALLGVVGHYVSPS